MRRKLLRTCTIPGDGMDCPPGPADVYALAQSFLYAVSGVYVYQGDDMTDLEQLSMMEAVMGPMPLEMAEDAKRCRPGLFKEHTCALKPLSKSEKSARIDPLGNMAPLSVSFQFLLNIHIDSFSLIGVPRKLAFSSQGGKGCSTWDARVGS
jgi:hypothetical protein